MSVVSCQWGAQRREDEGAEELIYHKDTEDTELRSERN